MGQRCVYTYKRKRYEPHEIDAVEYAKRYGEHMLAVKIQKWRNGKIKSDDFIGDLMNLCRENEDMLINSELPGGGA